MWVGSHNNIIQPSMLPAYVYYCVAIYSNTQCVGGIIHALGVVFIHLQLAGFRLGSKVYPTNQSPRVKKHLT